jgi:sulfite reductase alpha subunit-like flavoprotein
MMYNVRLPIANLQHAKALLQLRRVEDAEKTLRTALTYTDELDVDTKTRLLFNLATVAPTREEKDRLLEETIKLGGNLTSKAMAIVTRHIDHIRDGPVKQ